MLLKATQQALQIPGLARPMRFKREENCREQVALLHMISDYEMKLARDLDDAQQELAGIIRCFQDPNEDADEELRDIRENMCSHIQTSVQLCGESLFHSNQVPL